LPEPAPRCVALHLLVEDLLVMLRIGVGAAERSQPQRVLVTLRAEVAAPPPARDRVEEVVDYGWLAEQVRALASEEVQLLETLAIEIAKRAFAEPRLSALEITLRKPDIFADARAVGVCLRFYRSPQ
jgi:dihydroneopterin aldolase